MPVTKRPSKKTARKKKTAASRRGRAKTSAITPRRSTSRKPKPPTVTQALAVRGDVPAALKLQQAVGVARSTTLQRPLLTVEQAAILRAPLKQPEEVTVRPDGILYMEWRFVQSRLDLALQVGGWRLTDKTGIVVTAREKFDELMQTVAIEIPIKGEWVELARGTGRARAHKKNAQMAYGDSADALRSDGLKKAAKRLSIGLELRSKDWCRMFRATYCVAVWVPVTRWAKDGGEWKKVTKDEVQHRKSDKHGGVPIDGEKGPADKKDAHVKGDTRGVIDTEPVSEPQTKAQTADARRRRPEMRPPTDPDASQLVTNVRYVRKGTTNGNEWKLYEVTTGYTEDGNEREAVYGFFESDDFSNALLSLHEKQQPAILSWRAGKKAGTFKLTEVLPCVQLA